MSATEETNQMLTAEILSINKNYIDIGRKLDILVNSREHESKANDELKSEVSDLSKRLFEVEKVQAVNNVNLADFNTIKNSIIKWVVVIIGSAAVAIIAYMPKG